MSNDLSSELLLSAQLLTLALSGSDGDHFISQLPTDILNALLVTGEPISYKTAGNNSTPGELDCCQTICIVDTLHVIECLVEISDVNPSHIHSTAVHANRCVIYAC